MDLGPRLSALCAALPSRVASVTIVAIVGSALLTLLRFADHRRSCRRFRRSL
jgi:hypothetical protein